EPRRPVGPLPPSKPPTGPAPPRRSVCAPRGPSSSYRRPLPRRRRPMLLNRLFRSSKSRLAAVPRHRPATRPYLEALEDRTVPSTFTVENLADSGAGSLRQAILDANALPGADVIDFAPEARDGTIVLTSGQLSITDDLQIDGPGADRLAVSGND